MVFAGGFLGGMERMVTRNPGALPVEVGSFYSIIV